jgi:iron complex transport system substrate-binding protein
MNCPSKWILLALCVAMALTGCAAEGSPESTTATDTASEPVTATDEVTEVTVENCGVEVTTTAPPQRAITMNQHNTEVMLALGLEESMVGTAYLDDEIRSDLAAAYADIPVLAERYPSREEVLGAEPDFVYAGFASAFGDEAAGSREQLGELGIATYLSSEYCPDRTQPADFDTALDDILAIGELFGVPDRAQDVTEQMAATVAEVEELVADVEIPVRVAYTEGGDGAMFVAGGQGMFHEIATLAGAENVFADVDDVFTDISVEEFIDADPDIIVIGWCCDADPADIQAALEADPALTTVAAIEEGQFVHLGLSSLVAGVRNADAVRELAEAFYPDRF